MATIHNIGFNGNSYNPSLLEAVVGDTVNIPASTMHPAIQTTKADWNSGNNQASVLGWGKKTANFQIVLNNVDTIYYMCENHGPSGMKARIIVYATGSIKEGANLQFPKVGFTNPIEGNKLNLIGSFAIGDDIRIYNTQGQLLFTQTIDPESPQMILPLQLGTYYLRIRTQNGEFEAIGMVK